MVLNKSKLGKLVQYSPISEEKDKKLIKGIFSMNIISFKENQEVLQKVLRESPELFEELSDEDKQKELEESVLVDIYEKFEYDSEVFEGYFLEFKD